MEWNSQMWYELRYDEYHEAAMGLICLVCNPNNRAKNRDVLGKHFVKTSIEEKAVRQRMYPRDGVT